MKRIFLAVLLIGTTPTFACVNDRDTLAQEAAAQKVDGSGLPNVVRVITGRFERNPPRNYEMRLERVTNELKIDPTQLALYDDAAVACDRLKRSKEALQWMDLKKKQLAISKFDAKLKREHLYRYFANAGTFHAHLWIRSGANRKDMREMKTGREMIEKAIEIKPNAHFGRERYQLLLMKWILNPPQQKDKLSNDFLNLVDVGGSFETNKLKDSKYPDAVAGLSGLVVLGDAWGSVDVFYALSQALRAQGDNSISTLARHRYSELLEEGRTSVIPNFKPREIFDDAYYSIPQSDIQSMYLRLRADAVSYQYMRDAYMNEQFRQGRHPDINRNFWQDWEEPPLPSLEIQTPQQEQEQQVVKTTIQVSSYLLLGLTTLFLGVKLGRRRATTSQI